MNEEKKAECKDKIDQILHSLLLDYNESFRTQVNQVLGTKFHFIIDMFNPISEPYTSHSFWVCLKKMTALVFKKEVNSSLFQSLVGVCILIVVSELKGFYNCIHVAAVEKITSISNAVDHIGR